MPPQSVEPTEPVTASPRIVDVDGLRLAIDALDSLGLGHGQAFEPEILGALRRWVRPGDTVIDIGANIGYFTAHLARLVGPVGTVLAFEPAPANFELLAGNLYRNGFTGVRLYQAALGAERGDAGLHTSDFNGGMHRLYDSVCCAGPTVAVPVRRLDDVLGGTDVQLIKIDIEGYEPMALQGARACLRRSPRLKLVSEYCPPSMLEAGASPSAMLGELASLGLLPHELDGRPIELAELLDDAARHEGLGRDRLVSACTGRSPPEIAAIIERLTTELGCRRPHIENLLFSRPL